MTEMFGNSGLEAGAQAAIPVPGTGWANGAEAGNGREAYYAQARSWAQDRQQAQARSARLGWILAGVATGLAALEALALVALTPLKTVVPYTLLVDRNTGFAQALDTSKMPNVAGDTALTHALLAQYVIAREGFDISSISQQYRRVALWSAGAARGQYLAQMPASNPESPLARYPRSAVVEARVESVSPIGPQVALVRFSTLRRDGGMAGAAEQGRRAYWAAVVRYRFSGVPMAIEDRLINPLGFQVVDYRRDAEAAPVRDDDMVRPAGGGAAGPAGGGPGFAGGGMDQTAAAAPAAEGLSAPLGQAAPLGQVATGRAGGAEPPQRRRLWPAAPYRPVQGGVP